MCNARKDFGWGGHHAPLYINYDSKNEQLKPNRPYIWN